jgi:uncharacterized protein YbjT (DUF2867 family)
MIVVTTPTGQIGARVVRGLLDREEPCRVVVRDRARLADDVRDRVEVVEGSHRDPEVLDAALPGADALFWLVPPDPTAPSAHEHYLRFARAGRAAIARHGVGHVIGVSSAGHGWTAPAGVLSAAFAMDAELAASGAAYRALSLPFYLENLLGQVAAIREHGSLALTCAPDRPLATIAVEDIAAAALGLLTDRSWTGHADLPLFGPDRLTPDAIAAVISEELGRPVGYRRLASDDLAAGLRSAGRSERAVQDVVEMFAAQDDGIYDADWARATTAPTDLRTWCREVLVPAVAG